MAGRVVVAMSGGVDSSVVAVMLKKQGYEVIGVTMQLYDYGEAVEAAKQKTCCASRDITDAQNVARQFGFLHYVLNYESVFKQEVMDKFADDYLAGLTPIPCISCNQTVKFRDLYSFAKKLGANFLATGHYVKRVTDPSGHAYMHTAADLSKDQSYFLYSTTIEQLQFLRFPLADQDKATTRKMAEDFGIKTFAKPDSQDICFVPGGDYKSVVQKLRPEAIRHGNIVDIETGQTIGTHSGIVGYTIGQRRGIGLSSLQPKYVIKIDAPTNTIFVGERHHLLTDEVTVKDVNWLVPNHFDKTGEMFFRFRSSANSTSQGKIVSVSENQVKIKLNHKALSITPGQACVFYQNSLVVGGGVITH